jgi:hypothetical protein
MPGNDWRRRRSSAGSDPNRSQVVAAQHVHAPHPALLGSRSRRLIFGRFIGRVVRRTFAIRAARLARPRLGALGRPLPASAAGCGRFLVRNLIANANGLPAGAWREFSVRRGLDVIGARPSQPLSRRMAAAVSPTLLGGVAAAGIVLAGKRLAVIFGLAPGQRHAKHRREVCKQGDGGKEPAKSVSPKFPREPRHRARPGEFEGASEQESF